MWNLCNLRPYTVPYTNFACVKRRPLDQSTLLSTFSLYLWVSFRKLCDGELSASYSTRDSISNKNALSYLLGTDGGLIYTFPCLVFDRVVLVNM